MSGAAKIIQVTKLAKYIIRLIFCQNQTYDITNYLFYESATFDTPYE